MFSAKSMQKLQCVRRPYCFSSEITDLLEWEHKDWKEKEGDQHPTHACNLIYITLLMSLYRSILVLCFSVLQDFKFSSYRNIFIVHIYSEKFKMYSCQHLTQMIWHRGHRYHSCHAPVQLVWLVITAPLLLSKPLCCSELSYCSRLWERTKIQVSRWMFNFQLFNDYLQCSF